MDQVHVVRHKVLVEKISQREVARQLNVSRNTVAKYLIESAPVRQQSKTRSAPVCAQVLTRFNELYEEWQPRSTAKQRITGLRLHRQLVEEGFRVGKTSVYKLLRERRRRSLEVFIPLSYQPGETAQVDFFEVTVEIAGVRRTVWKFVCRLMYSGYDFAWLYERCDQLSFLDAHVRAFTHFNGVPARLIYDNLSAAVHRRVGLYGFERKLTQRFAALASHYLFEPCFTRPGQGHDKGGVEARGRGIRLQHLTPIPAGESLRAVAQQLLTQLTNQATLKKNAVGATGFELFEHEHPLLRALPAAVFDARLVRLLSASSRSTVQLDGVIYSVPSRWARLEVTAFIGVEEIRLTCLGESCLHPRAEKGSRRIQYRHYLPELARKPQAVRQVAPALLKELGEPFIQLWDLLVATHGPLEAARVLARLLATITPQSEATIKGLLRLALQSQTTPASAPPSCELLPDNEVPVVLRQFHIEARCARDYDHLLHPGGRL